MDINSLNEKDIIEAALFLFDRPVTFQELSEIIQTSENEIESYIEEIRDEYLDQNTAYYIADVEDQGIQLKLREEIALHLHWPFIKRSEVPRHLLKVLSLIAFKEYARQETVSPSKMIRIFGKTVTQDIDELQAMNLVNITIRGKKKEITVTEDFLTLFKLPQEPEKVKDAIQMGLRNYALRQLQANE
jgi:chromosome segregation and condensation protein ScpB